MRQAVLLHSQQDCKPGSSCCGFVRQKEKWKQPGATKWKRRRKNTSLIGHHWTLTKKDVCGIYILSGRNLQLSSFWQHFTLLTLRKLLDLLNFSLQGCHATTIMLLGLEGRKPPTQIIPLWDAIPQRILVLASFRTWIVIRGLPKVLRVFLVLIPYPP